MPWVKRDAYLFELGGGQFRLQGHVVDIKARVQHFPCGVKNAGRVMVVSGELSDTLSTYSIDAASGALKPIGKYSTGKGSNWVEIVTFD